MREFKIEKLNRLKFDMMLDCAHEFFYESDFKRNLTANVPKYYKLLEKHIGHPLATSIIAVADDMVVGYVNIYAQDDFTDEMIGELFQFYVRKEYRGTRVGRALAEAACKQWDEWKCKRCYVEGAPGLENPMAIKMFKNLWAKFGFSEIGIVLVRNV